ncbi:unnamed protein product, partial [Discosporangium mesarthrocarpum]
YRSTIPTWSCISCCGLTGRICRTCTTTSSGPTVRCWACRLVTPPATCSTRQEATGHMIRAQSALM